MKYKNVSVFNPNFDNTDLPVFVGERRLLVGVPTNPEINPTYREFYNQLGVFIDKISDSPAKSAVNKLFQRNLIFLGKDVTTPAKNGIVGSFLINKTKFAGIVIDTVEAEIDYMTGETSNIDMSFYISYFEFIRATAFLNMSIIKTNKKLHLELIKYLYYIYLKLIGTNIILNTKQKQFLNIVISYFFYRFMLNNNHESTRELIFSELDKETQFEVTNIINKLERYTSMKDISKGLIDFNITNENPLSLMVKMITKFKPTVFYSLVSTLDYLIAISIVSKYPMKLFKPVFVSNDIQDKIENIIYPMLNHLSFDTNSVSSLS